jgi:hypothetical protein
LHEFSGAQYGDRRAGESLGVAGDDGVDSGLDGAGEWIDRAHPHRKPTKLVLDMDSSASETSGQQQGSAYNGHFGCTCSHPLFVFNQFGDLERVMLRGATGTAPRSGDGCSCL